MTKATKPIIVGHKFRDGSQIHGDADLVAAEFDRLSDGGSKPLTAGAVLKAARQKRSPLHEYFDWDDTTAAEKWRLNFAHQLIGAVQVIVEQGDREPMVVRAFVSHDREAQHEAGYTHVSIAFATGTPDLLQRALEELAKLERRYRELQELKPVFAALARVRAAG